MSEFFENRLFLPPEEQPSFSMEIDGCKFELTWDDTCLKTYRLESRPELDDALAQFNHLAHSFQTESGEDQILILFYDQMDSAALDALSEADFPRMVRPNPEEYILKKFEERELASIPDSIGPELGAS